MSNSHLQVSRKIPTREKLIRAALILFQSRGYHAIGVNDILKTAGVAKGSLYHIFPDGKAALAVAVVEWLTLEMTTHFKEAEILSTAPTALISALFEDTGKWLVQNDFSQGALLAVLAQEISAGDELLFAAVSKGYSEAVSSLASALDPSAPNIELAQTLLSALDGGVAMSRAAQSVEPLRASLKVLLPLLEGS